MADVSTLLASDFRAGDQEDPSAGELAAQLRRSVLFRSADAAYQLLAKNSSMLRGLRPCFPGGGILLGLASFWINSGLRGEQASVAEALSHYGPGSCGELSLTECAYIFSARGLLAMSSDGESAIQHLQTVRAIAAEIPDALPEFMALFGLARAHRREGNLAQSQRCCMEAAAVARREQWYTLLAHVQVFTGSLQMLTGDYQGASDLFERAQPLLVDSLDPTTLGDMYNAQARIARAQAKYREALDLFEQAISAYRIQKTVRLKLARALLHTAETERLLAGILGRRSGSNRLSEADLLPESALQHCCIAEKIFQTHHEENGLADVHVFRASLYLDGDEMDCAEEELAAAVVQSRRTSNAFLRARIALLQSRIENVHFEYGLAQSEDARPLQRAARYAAQAAEDAGRVGSKQLLARAYIWEATTLCNRGEILEALDQAEKAASLVSPDNVGLVRDDLTRLRRKLARVSSVETKLRAWSLGVTGERTLDQIAEEFRDILIRSVWDKERRDVTRVAKRLSLSPRAVNRVLKRLGLFSRTHPDDFDSV